MTEEKALNIVEKTINKVYEKVHLLENQKEVLTVENNKLKKQLSLLNSSSQLKEKIEKGIKESKKEIAKIVEDEDFRLGDNAQWSKQLGFARGKLNSLTDL